MSRSITVVADLRTERERKANEAMNRFIREGAGRGTTTGPAMLPTRPDPMNAEIRRLAEARHRDGSKVAGTIRVEDLFGPPPRVELAGGVRAGRI